MGDLWTRFTSWLVEWFTTPVDPEVIEERAPALIEGPTEEAPTEEARPAPPPPPRELPVLQPDSTPPIRSVSALRICLDFGTTACAAAWPQGMDAVLAELVLESREPRLTRNTIASVLAVPRDLEAPAVLGAPAAHLRDQADPRYTYTRSLKRLLSDGARRGAGAARLAHALEKVIEELVTLAVTPARSGTLAAEAAILEQPVDARGLGIPGFPVDRIVRQGLELHLTVPNAFGAFECELLEHAAGAALRRFLERWHDDQGAAPPDRILPVRLVREADAVVWWELARWRAKNPRASDLPAQRWLVFDVGGGSTDAALVLAEVADGLPRVAIERHSGVTLGGNDVDEALLRCVADQLGEGPVSNRVARAVAAIAGTGPEARRAALAQIAAAKIDWSGEVHRVLGEARMQGHELAGAWDAWLAQVVEGPAVEPDGIAGSELEFGAYGRQAVPTCAHADWSGRIAALVRAMVGTVVDDLFGDEVGAVDRVIVSGRGALQPGLFDALASLMVERGLVASRDRIATTTPAGPDDRDAMKLACVRGACASTASARGGVGHFVGQEITYRLELRPETRIWRAGTRLLPGGHARAVVQLPRVGRDARVAFRQRRFPTAIDGWVTEAGGWTSRVIGTLDVPLAEPCSLLVRFDSARFRLALWQLQGDHAHRLPDPPDDAAPPPQNPITGLPFGWGDAS